MTDTTLTPTTPETSASTDTSTQPSTLDDINADLDAVVNYFSDFATKEANYQQQIADLQSKLAAATTLANSDESEIATFRDKLAKLKAAIPTTPSPN